MNPQSTAIIRSAQPGDEVGILACIQELADYEHEPDAVLNTPEMLRNQLFGDSPNTFALVAQRDQAIIGIAIWFLNYSTWTGTNGIWLEDLYVQPAERGNGIGKQFLTRLSQICQERGYHRLEWTVLDWNEPSINFYRSLGAFPMDEWTTFRLTGKPLEALASHDN